MRLLVLASVVFGCLCVAPAMAAPTKNMIDPQAQGMLRQSAAAYGALHSLTCEVRTELRLNGEAHGRIIQISLAYQKPSQAAVSVLKDGETTHFLCDDHTFYVSSPDQKEYIQRAVAGVSAPVAGILMQGESMIGLILFKPAGLTALANGATAKSLTLGPLETLDKIAARTVTRVIARTDGSTMTFRVTLGVKDHLIHKFATTIQSPTPLVDNAGNVRQIDNSETYTNLQIDPILPASAFLPPPGAKVVTPDAPTQK